MASKSSAKKRKSINYGPSEKRDFHVYDKVFAKMRGYPPWPAKITNIDVDPKNKSMKSKCEVYFYGTNQLGQCPFSDIHDYEANKDRFSHTAKSAKQFAKAIKEIEADNGPLLEETGEEDVVTVSFAGTENDSDNKKDGETPAKKPRPSAPVKGKSPVTVKSPANKGKSPTNIVTGVKNAAGSTPVPVKTFVSKGKQTDLKSKSDEMSTTNSSLKPKLIIKPCNQSLTPKIDKTESTNTNSTSTNLTNLTKGDTKPKVVITALDGTPLHLNSPKPKRVVVQQNQNIHTDTPRPRKPWNKSLDKTDPASPTTFLASPSVLESKEPLVLDVEDKPVRTKDEELVVETTLITLESILKKALHINKPDFDTALKAMEAVLKLDLTALMLKKNPHVFDTFRKVERYGGDHIKRHLDESERSKFDSKAAQVRSLASRINGEKFPALFVIPRSTTFIEHFRSEIVWFSAKIADRALSANMSLTTHDF